MNFLELVLKEQQPDQMFGCHCDVDWKWLGEGLLCFTPHKAYEKVVVLSAGIHGNETAPIELLDQICRDIFSQNLILNVRLLLVLGNPIAIRQGSRYVENDMNRMFCGGHQHLDVSHETQRAKKLEQALIDFFTSSDIQASRYHYDLHTAIRTSLLPTFALLPYQMMPYDQILLESLYAAELDAVVYHNAFGRTFTHFSCSMLKVASVTLELGSAKPFGHNNLSQFQAIDQVLRSILSGAQFPQRKKEKAREFRVIHSILKLDDDFKLNLAIDAPNFTIFEYGAVIASQASCRYIASKNHTRILFPNPTVKKGLRAGLILEEIE